MPALLLFPLVVLVGVVGVAVVALSLESLGWMGSIPTSFRVDVKKGVGAPVLRKKERTREGGARSSESESEGVEEAERTGGGKEKTAQPQIGRAHV